MQNVAPHMALVRRSRQLLQVAFLVVSVGVFTAVVGLAMFVLPLAPAANTTFRSVSGIVFVFGVILGISGLLMALRAVTWRTDNDLAKMTGDFLAKQLDARYTFIRNVSKFGLGYVDAVLVGPQGVLVFRIVGEEGTFFNEVDKWLKRDPRGGWVPLRYNPTQQAVDDIKHLREYFKRRGLPDVPVFGAVVFTAPNVNLSAEKPAVPPAQLPTLLERLSTNYMARERIDQRAVDAIVKTLYTT